MTDLSPKFYFDLGAWMIQIYRLSESDRIKWETKSQKKEFEAFMGRVVSEIRYADRKSEGIIDANEN